MAFFPPPQKGDIKGKEEEEGDSGGYGHQREKLKTESIRSRFRKRPSPKFMEK